MKDSEISYIWIFTDQYGDMQTEFIFPEEVELKPPYQAVKYSWNNPESKALRYKISVSFNGELVNGVIV